MKHRGTTFNPHNRIVTIKFRQEDFLKIKAAAKSANRPAAQFIRIMVLEELYCRPSEIKAHIEFLQNRIKTNIKRLSEMSPVREIEIKVLQNNNITYMKIKKILEKEKS